MASFFPEEIPETISLGATYPDYATFTRKFEEYCKDTGYEFSTNSKTIESANKLILNDEKHFAKKFKYICVQFVCKHVRGSEMNEKKSSRGCPAMIRLCANRSKDVLEVTKFNDIHVHSVKDRASEINVDRPANEATDSSDDVTPEVSTTKVQPANDQNETSPGDNSNSIVPQDGDETFTPIDIKGIRKKISEIAIKKAVEIIHKQLVYASISNYIIHSSIPGEIAEITDGNQVYLLSDNLQTCSCVFHEMVQLPCAHIFAARQFSSEAQIYVESMIPEYCRKDYKPHYYNAEEEEQGWLTTEEKKLISGELLSRVFTGLSGLEGDDLEKRTRAIHDMAAELETEN